MKMLSKSTAAKKEEGRTEDKRYGIYGNGQGPIQGVNACKL